MEDVKARARNVKSMVASAALLCVVGLGCSRTESRELLGYVPPSPVSVGEVSITEVGAESPFTFAAADGELLVVYFGYTNCPDLCPATMVAVRNAKRKLGDLAARVDLAMITVDPERDTPEVLPRYLASFSDRFHALVPASTEELRDAERAFQATSSVTKKDDGTIEVTHSTVTYVVDETGTVLVEWPFGTDAESMAHDLEILLSRKGQS